MQLTVEFDDVLYHDLLQKVGKNNISQFIQAVVRPQLYISNSLKKSSEKSDLINGLTLEQRRERLQSLAGSWEGEMPEIDTPFINERESLL